MKKWLIRFLLLAIVLIAIIAYKANKAIYSSNTKSDQKSLFYIQKTDSHADILSNLVTQDLIKDDSYLQLVAKLMKFTKSSVKPGRYEIEGKSSNHTIIDKLRKGAQSPIILTITNARTIEQLAGRVASQIMADSLEVLNAIRAHQTNKQSKEQTICTYLPDSYEVYWTIKPEEFATKMEKEQSKFWQSNDRTEKAKSKNMSSCEVYTLASIVEKETNHNPEKERLAGVYLNRIQRGIPLQADPTVVFATQEFDLRRVLNKHLAYDSPYNTYKYPGLPPGPICIPSKKSIDAVLNAEKHNYLYFCAKADDSKTHAFAKTLTEHNRNARKFHNWLNAKGIR